MKAFLLVLLVANIVIDTSHQAEWSYDNEAAWPGVCQTGMLQSPINIMSRDAVVDVYGAHIRGDLQFRGYGDVRITARNTGHALQWDLVEGTPAPVVSGGPLRGNYTFLQFHLHWLSEHAIDGMKYPMEIHLVHTKTGLTFEEAAARPDGITVIGVMAQIYSKDDSYRTLEQITDQVSNLTENDSGPTPPINIDLTRLISPNAQSYYTYHGSLTTPDCQEAVTWIVMDKPVLISDSQFKLFSNVDVGAPFNYRSLQPTNRMVYRSVASCSALLVPNILGTLTGLLACLSSSVVSGVNKGICALINAKRKLFGDKYKQCLKLN